MTVDPFNYRQMRRRADVEHTGVTTAGEGWTGWVVFASFVMVLLGLWHVGVGLLTLIRGVDAQSAPALAVSEPARGWADLALGVVFAVTAYFLLRGRLWARILTVAVCLVDVLTQFTLLAVWPLWSVTMIVLGVVTLYAIIVHGGTDTLE